MDEFAVLRRQLHQELSGHGSEAQAETLRRLYDALLGVGTSAEPGLERVRRARLLAAGAAGHGRELLSLLGRLGSDPYLDRYLSDALHQPRWAGVIEAWSRRAGKALGGRPAGARRGRGSAHRDALLELAAEHGLSFAVPEPEPPEALAQLRRAGFPRKYPRPVLVQTMFYGDPARAGRGNSGGIATLLRDLGDALAGSAGLGQVFTVVPYNLNAAGACPLRAVEELGPGHTLLRLPVALASEDALGFLRSHARIRSALVRLLRRLHLHPDLLHVRFLDDASLAAARGAQALGTALVTTLTPDPHRGLCDSSGSLRPLGPAAALEALNKIGAGDELLRRSRGLVGIGRRAVREQLLPYFPQLEDAGRRVVTGIDEGIRLEVRSSGLTVADLLAAPALELRLAQPAGGRPLMLNVGRLSPLKGQLHLLAAWLEGGWWRRYDLVFIGGDLANPSPTEARVIEEMRRQAAAWPQSAGHLAHLEARPNGEIREIEAFFGARCLAPDPDLYVCSSLKEEFGLSIIEAMAAGMVVCAPIRGGAKRYLSHGVNGFLIDTTDAFSLNRELHGLLDGPPMSRERVQALQHNARETVRREFSIEQVAKSFAAFYGQVLDAPAREEENDGR